MKVGQLSSCLADVVLGVARRECLDRDREGGEVLRTVADCKRYRDVCAAQHVPEAVETFAFVDLLRNEVRLVGAVDLAQAQPLHVRREQLQGGRLEVAPPALEVEAIGADDAPVALVKVDAGLQGQTRAQLAEAFGCVVARQLHGTFGVAGVDGGSVLRHPTWQGVGAAPLAHLIE